MGWIKPEDKMPPSGLLVLLEVSGYWTAGLMSDHDYELGCWLGNPDGNREPFWLIHGAVEYCGKYHELTNPTVHAWMPLPKHFQPQEMFGEPDDDLMEHAMFEDDPEWLYKGKYTYEQMSLEEFMGMEASEMIIMSLNGTNIINMDCVENIFLGADRKSIKANMTSRSGCELAKYSDYECCKYALEALYLAIKNEDKVFQFPKEEDMKHAKQYSSHCTSRKRSHGGS